MPHSRGFLLRYACYVRLIPQLLSDSLPRGA